MTLKELKSKWWWRTLTNKYVLISLVFAVWILFLDANAWFTSQRELDQQISEKEENIAFYRRGIAADQEKIATLKDSAGIEKFARERYLMKKENEEVFIIQHEDSIKD